MDTMLNLGDLVTHIYEEMLRGLGDEELAAVATAAAVNDILQQQKNLAEQVSDVS